MTFSASKKTEDSAFSENIVEKISENINSYIIRPSTFFGISGFVFDSEGSSSVTHSATITDNFVEDNTSVQDHIAVQPVKLTLNRFIGELSYKLEDGILPAVADVATRLAPVVAFAPVLTASAKNAKDLINSEKAVGGDQLNEADNLFALFKNLNPFASKKQRAYIYFKALSEQGATFSVQTPFMYFTNMAIETITAEEPEDNSDIANFSLTLKQIRVAKVQTRAPNKKDLQVRAQTQQAAQTDAGRGNGNTTNESTLFKGLKPLGVQSGEGIRQ